MVLTTSLVGCGGASVGYEYSDDGYYDDGRPAVSLVTSSDVARTGDVVRLVAAASDDYAIDHVDFYSVDAQGRGSLITTVRQPPYTVDVIVPASQGGVMYFMATAVDDSGQSSDSSIVAVDVVP